MEDVKMKDSALNDWFLSLPEGRQRALRDDKWTLADAFGKSIHEGLVDELQAKTDLLALVVVEKCELVEENAELREALEILFKANDAFLPSGEMMDYDDFERIKQLLNK